MSDCRVRRWTSAEFLAGREAWQSLLARSSADPLFMSWDWMRTWWDHHGGSLQAELRVLAVHSQEGDLVGLAPFYSHRAVHRKLLHTRRLELLGNTWRDPAAIFSEYLDVIARHDAGAGVCAALREWLRADAEWDELVLCNLRADSVAARLVRGPAAEGVETVPGDRTYVRAVESMTGWSLALPPDFESFAARLSSNTRRKVVNQRAKFAGVSFEITPAADRTAALARLDAFVARRFRTSVGDDARTRARFHADILACWAGTDIVHLTELRVGGKCISVMLNLRLGGTEYYLQSGFDAAYGRGLSPGLLHLGYAIEAACRDGIRRFDFLAGRGLHRDYKQDFAADRTPLNTLHVVRKPALRALFRIVDRLRGRTSHTARIGS